MSDYARPTPTIPTIPTWTLEHLKAPQGRTYGTPAEHLEREARRATLALIGHWTWVVLGFLAFNGGALAYALWFARQPQSTPTHINFLLGGLVIANVFLAAFTGTVKHLRAATAKRGRTVAGLRGEQRVAEALEKLPQGYYVIHGIDITAPNRPPEDIDHLVVGPNGITTVDAKNWGGDVVIDESGVYHHGKLDAGLIDGTRRRAQTLAAFLGYDTSIRQVVCFTGSAHPRAHAHGIHFTDLGGLLKVLTSGPKALTSEVSQELAEDAALLAPTATTRMPWRHQYIGVQPKHQRAYKLRFLRLPTHAVRTLLTIAALPLTIWAVIHLFNLYSTPEASPVLPTVLIVAGAALGLLAWQRLGSFKRYLTIPKTVYLETFRAPRAQGRMDRVYASIATTAPATRDAPKAVKSTPEATAASATQASRKALEEAFTKELILPPDTLEELVTVQMLLTRSDEFRASWGQDLPYGIILHGPPGTGKTQIARTIAKTAGFAFLAAKPSDLRDKYVGESAKRIAELYEDARKNAPAMVFLDEIDATAGKRGSSSDGAGQENNHAVNQLLQEIDGITKSDAPVFTIGATNLLGDLDDAVKSRLAYQILIDLPDDEARERMWRLFARAFLHRIEVPLDELVHASYGMSGRDIKQVCQIAAQLSFGQDSERVTRGTLERAFERVGHSFKTPVN